MKEKTRNKNEHEQSLLPRLVCFREAATYFSSRFFPLARRTNWEKGTARILNKHKTKQTIKLKNKDQKKNEM